MGAGRTIKSYIFWTYERGTFHYDVMVTLILVFLFVTPHLWNYGDHPSPTALAAGELRVQVAPGGSLQYEIPAALIRSNASAGLETALQQAIDPISGPVIIDRSEEIRDGSGHVSSYRVWAHR